MNRSILVCLAAAAVCSASGATWELRGFFGPSASPEISLRDTADGRSRWVSTGEFDGDVYVERADAASGIAVIHVGGERLTLRLAAESPVSDRRPEDGDEPVGDGNESRALPVVAGRFANDASEGLRRLAADHPEYFDANKSDATRRAFLEARREIIRRAAEAARAEAAQ